METSATIFKPDYPQHVKDYLTAPQRTLRCTEEDNSFAKQNLHILETAVNCILTAISGRLGCTCNINDTKEAIKQLRKSIKGSNNIYYDFILSDLSSYHSIVSKYLNTEEEHHLGIAERFVKMANLHTEMLSIILKHPKSSVNKAILTKYSDWGKQAKFFLSAYVQEDDFAYEYILQEVIAAAIQQYSIANQIKAIEILSYLKEHNPNMARELSELLAFSTQCISGNDITISWGTKLWKYKGVMAHLLKENNIQTTNEF